MGNSENNKRIYILKDNQMKYDADIMHMRFVDDLSDFESFDASFNTAFADNWRALIDGLSGMEDDDLLVAQQRGLTEQVSNAMQESKKYYQSAKFFIQKAFPDDPAIWEEFGFSEYIKSHTNVLKMGLFMDEFYKVADKYRTKLIHAGFSAASITKAKTLRDDLNNKNRQQELFKRNRKVKTVNRIAKLNQIWEIMSLVSRASKIIYCDDYAKYKQYKMPTPEKRGRPAKKRQ